MYLEMACVEAFHNKLGVSAPTDWEDNGLQRMGKQLVKMSKELEPQVKEGDVHALRAHLLLEELGEYLLAEDEVEALDGLTDMLYVLLGAAVTYNWPLANTFAEVHRSNMSKEKQPDDELGNRVREKGASYEPPQLKVLLDLHRQGVSRVMIETARTEVRNFRKIMEGNQGVEENKEAPVP